MKTTKTNKKPQHNRYYKSPRRKAEDKLAKGLNCANGGCFSASAPSKKSVMKNSSFKNASRN